MPTKRRGKKVKGFAKPGRKDSETGTRHHRNSENNRISHGLRESGETPAENERGGWKDGGTGHDGRERMSGKVEDCLVTKESSDI